MASNPESSVTVEIPPLDGVYAEPFSARKLLKLASFFGPAAVLASLSIGAGETIIVVGVGAWAEYGLLWLVLLSVVVKGVCVTYLLGRFTAVSGQHLGHQLVHLPGPRGWLLWLIIGIDLLVLGTALTAIAKPCGNLMVHLLEPWLPGFMDRAAWDNLVALLFLAAALVLSLFTSYDSLEKQQIIICGILVGGTILAVLLVGPNIWKVLKGTFQFGYLPPVPEWGPEEARKHYFLNLATVFGYVGGSMTGYIAYANWVALRGWGLNRNPRVAEVQAQAREARQRIDYLPSDATQIQRLRKLLAPLRWDVAMGAVVLFIVTAAFMVSGAAVLFPRREILPKYAFDLLTRQKHIWMQIHQGLVPIYYIAVLAALWGTLATVPETITRVSHEFLGIISPRLAKISFRRLQLYICIWFFVSSCFWVYSKWSFDLLTQVAALLSTNLGVATLSILAIYLNYQLPPRYRVRWWFLLVTVLSAAVLMAAFAGSAVGLIQKAIESGQVSGVSPIPTPK